MGAVFLTLLHMSLAASGLVIAVMVLRLLLKQAPKAIHCALWALVALRLLLPFSVESPFSLIPEDVAEGEILSEWQDDYVGEVTIIPDDSPNYDAAIAAGREPIADDEGHYYVVTEPETVETAVLPILGWIWLSGCVAMLGYAIVSFLRIRKRVQVSLLLRTNIWRSEAVDSPFILGFFRPKIYLPYSMDEQQTQYVIAHEEAHLRRRDHWWKPLGFLLLAVYWFNPLLWVAYILLCRDIELACDERVIRDMDAQEKKAYSEALLSCSLPRHMVAACPLAFGEVGVKTRITSVLNYKKPAFWVMVVAVIACVVVAVCFLTNPKSDIDGEVYTYEKAGILGNFTITLFEDGTFAYTEGMASSYHATGHWQEAENILTLTDDGGYGLVNHFRRDGDTLVFLAENSSNFTYVEVQDGERFVYTMDVNIPIPQGDWDGMQTIVVPGYAVINDTLSEEEITAFNELLAPIVYDKQGNIIGTSPWSCFFTSLYSDVREMDFELFMRCFPGDGSTASAAEVELLKKTEHWPFAQEDTLDTIPVPIHKYPARLVDMILLEYAGITTADLDTSGVAYLEEYDAYYNYTSDFASGSFHCTRGEIFGEILYLYSETELRTNRLTLRKEGDSYQVVALQRIINGEVVGEFVTPAQLFDTIVSSPADASNPTDYLESHPEEHEALLSNKEDTLRYIFTEFLEGGQEEPRGQVMRTVLDKLAPEAQLRLYTETGQEYFDAWMESADRVASDHGLEWLEVNQPALYLALQIRSEIYGHSSPAFPADAPKLPKPLKLESEVQQAACNAILASLSTGWWTAQELDPAYEAAAFTCFHHHTVGDEVNLYGFGGYFSQDAQGNAADEWSSFTIVTLNASTLDLIQVWWPGDGGYYVMSIEESFIDYLVEPVIMISSDDYQSLQKALRKQAVENMAPATSHASVKTQCPAIDGVEVHTPGSYIKSEWKQSSKFDKAVHCHYDVQWDYAICLRCDTPFSYETPEESYAVHRKEVMYNEDGSEKGFICADCGYRSW